MNINTYIFCGGGSGGHVLPAITLIKALQEQKPGAQIYYLGSYQGIEAELIQAIKIPYSGISTGKLRRYFSWENFTDLFRLARGFLQSFFFLLRFASKTTVIVSTGGFVTVPVVIAAWVQGKKIVIHEQTSRVGLANKLGSYFARKVLLTYQASSPFFPQAKTRLTGYPLRKEIFLEQPDIMIKEQKLSEMDRPILFLTGGGNGSKLLNEQLKHILPTIRDRYFIVHQVGKSFYKDSLKDETEYYKVFDFIGEEMIPLMKKAQVIISRAGAGTVVELMSLGKPSIFIPLKMAQKNEQYHNAMEAKEKLGSLVITEDQLNPESLLQAIDSLSTIPSQAAVQENPTQKILAEIESVC